MKAIAIFRSSAFNLSWPKEGSDPNKPALGRDLAEHLRNRFAKIGLSTSNPIEGSDHWVLDLEMQGRRLSMVVHWAPIGNPPIDYWVVQPQERLGIVASLLRKQKEFDFEPLRSALKRVLEEDANVQALEWLDDADFRQRY